MQDYPLGCIGAHACLVLRENAVITDLDEWHSTLDCHQLSHKSSHYCGASIPLQLLSSAGGPIRILMNGEHLESFSKSGREPGIISAVLLPAIDFV